MTKEIAIHNLYALKLRSKSLSDRDALDMAIKALEQQPCEDSISREVVKDMLTAEWTKYMPMELDINLSFVLDKISALPSVTPSYNSVKTELEQTRWIPVSERLPLCEQEVLICTQRRSISGKTKSIITSAIYEDGNMRECYSRWHWEDIEYESWDEEEDCGIIPEGWWEYRHYNPDEVYNNLVDDFILAWMPLPQPYKAESEDKE